MTTTTELRLQYVHLPRDHGFPPEIEVVVDEDCVIHKHFYDQNALNRVRALLM
jgi:hypothetical protein